MGGETWIMLEAIIGILAFFVLLRVMFLWGHATGERDEYRRQRPQRWEHEE